MKTITESVDFNCEAKTLWDILSDASRCDWVPTVNEIKLEEDCRIFEMQGMGKVKEKILINEFVQKCAAPERQIANIQQSMQRGAMTQFCPELCPEQKCLRKE